MDAFIAWTGCRVFIQAVDGLRQQTGSGGLASAAWTCEQVGVDNAVTHDRITQRLYDMLLPDNFIPFLGAPFIIESLGHKLSPLFH